MIDIDNLFEQRNALRRLRRECEGRLARQEKRILICAGTGCVAGGAHAIYERFTQVLRERNIPCAVSLEEEVESEAVAVKKSGCHGFCEKGPLVRIEPWGYLYTKVREDDCAEIVARTIARGECLERLLYNDGEKSYPKQTEIPFYQKQTRLVLENCGRIDATSVLEYIAAGGYIAFEKALFDMDAARIISQIDKALLRGRGGGGFPTGKKWAQVRKQEADVKYLVCNGDEGDPGAFMDRSIMEGDPHRLLEGMMIGALAGGATEGYIYVRAEYPLAVERLRNAIDQARAYGFLGEHIFGTDFSFDIKISRGAGAFVCGEGSALTESIAGRRGMPRAKPPRTVEQGLFGKPTILNNVETFANVPLIIQNGADWYRGIGTEKSPGTKTFALTGNIMNTGLIEAPMGITLREIIFDIGGGMRDGKAFKAVQIGGPSGGCLTSEHFDMPLDFDSLQREGTMIGSGGLVVMDEDACMVEVARFFMNFTQNESCGKCVPCREGTHVMLELLRDITEGRGTEAHIDTLLELADTITHTALCGLGKTASSPVVSTIRQFRKEYLAHVIEKRCPTGTCKALTALGIDPEKCRGCTKCLKVCPVDAIQGSPKRAHGIDAARCIKCKACIDACPFKAIAFAG
jgi:NADH-quinone oxidoreductase subunit F